MKNRIILLSSIAVFTTCLLSCFSSADEIYLNQVGYLANSPKIAIVEGRADKFKITDIKGGELLSGKKGPFIEDKNTGKKVSKIDFSEITAPGNYYLYFGNAQRDMIIADNPYKELLESTINSFYLQRCGAAVGDTRAKFKHKQCHSQDGRFAGGWHDAGDYGKYMPPANYAVSTLLFTNVATNEIKYELNWMLTMQDKNSGGVHHKITRKDFEPFILPDEDKEPRYLAQISSTATAGFTGTMAQAYTRFKVSDPKYANTLRKAAINAWRFLEKNPAIVPQGGFNNDPGTNTGVYGDNDDGDERLFAAIQLYNITGNQKYHKYFIENYKNYSPNNTANLGWQDFRHHAYISYLLLPENKTSPQIRAHVKTQFISLADKLVKRGDKDGFNLILTSNDFRWGSNGLLMDYAKALIFAYIFSGEEKYKETALEQLHYILGRNAHDICFVTGFGEKTVTQLHHRPSIASGIELRGFMAGGPNRFLQDEKVRTIFSGGTPPALIYLDDIDSYSTNENSIYWNASLLFVLNYFSK